MGNVANRFCHLLRRSAGAAVGALALIGTMGLTAAHADPTPDPSPDPGASQTPTPTGSETATPSPTPPVAESTTPTPTPTESATARPSPTPSTRPTIEPSATAEAEPAPRPAAVKRSAVGEDEAAVEALAEPVADERFSVAVDTRCGGGADESRVEVRLGLRSAEDLTLDYVLTNDEDAVRTGTVTLTTEDFGATLEFTSLPVGTYHIDLLPEGGAEPLAVQNFDILTCLGVSLECGQVTFSNPSTNPALSMIYGEGVIDEPEIEEQFVLAPGGSRLIRTRFDLIFWLAETWQRGAGDNSAHAVAGEVTEAFLPQNCAPDPPVVAYVFCTTPGHTSRMTVTVRHETLEYYSYEILDTDGDVVAGRTVDPNGNLRDEYEETLPGLGFYRLNYYSNGSKAPVQSTVFQVQQCVKVSTACGAATVSNPKGNRAVVLYYFTPGLEDPAGDPVIRPGRSRTIDWRPEWESFRYQAFSVSRSPFTEFAGNGRVAVLEDCPPAAGPDDGLADTGGGPATLVGLVGGAGLVLGGSGVLIGRRRRT